MRRLLLIGFRAKELNPNDHRSEYEMLKQVLVEKFAGRYEVE